MGYVCIRLVSQFIEVDQDSGLMLSDNTIKAKYGV